MSDFEERRLEKKNFSNRLLFIYIFFGFLFTYFLSKTYSLQISSFSDYEIAALKNKTREVLIQPRRGIIYDKNNNILVNNIPSYNLIVSPSQILNPDILLKNIQQVISLNSEEQTYFFENFEVKASLNRELTIKKNLSSEEIARFEVRKHKFPNVFIDERFSRQHMYPHLFSHAIGFVGNPNNDELEEIFSDQDHKLRETRFNYSNAFLHGKTGIESIYDKELRGIFGKKVYEVDAKGKLLKELKFIAPVPGRDLNTSLDIDAQKVAYDELDSRRGAVVAVDLDTGEINTYVSSPTFSANKISNGLSSSEFDRLLEDENKPFFDRAGQGRYSPASTIKPAIALFGLENNIIDWDSTIDDPGFFVLPEDGRVYRGWKKGGHGNINLNDAIIESSNTFFFSLAYQSDIDELIEHLSYFGFGRNVCKDCFFPDNGLLPNPQWKINNLNFGWFKGDTVNIGVGQGYLSATPIQLAYYASFLANKGNLNNLSFVKNNIDPKVETFKAKNIIDTDWQKLHDSMIGVIENPKGTAKRLKNLKNYIIAAKSGTVELVSTDTKEDYKIIREVEGKRDHAIIVAFGPMPNPKYAVSVVIENGESGGSVAGPVAIKVLNSLLKK